MRGGGTPLKLALDDSLKTWSDSNVGTDRVLDVGPELLVLSIVGRNRSCQRASTSRKAPWCATNANANANANLPYGPAFVPAAGAGDDDDDASNRAFGFFGQFKRALKEREAENGRNYNRAAEDK